MSAVNGWSHIASTNIYNMESPIDTAPPPTVWDLHINTIKRGSLMLAQLQDMCTNRAKRNYGFLVW